MCVLVPRVPVCIGSRMHTRVAPTRLALTAGTVVAVTIAAPAARASFTGLDEPGLYASSRVVQAQGGSHFDTGEVWDSGLFGPRSSTASHTLNATEVGVTTTAAYGLLTADSSYTGTLTASGNERFVEAFSTASLATAP